MSGDNGHGNGSASVAFQAARVEKNLIKCLLDREEQKSAIEVLRLYIAEGYKLDDKATDKHGRSEVEVLMACAYMDALRARHKTGHSLVTDALKVYVEAGGKFTTKEDESTGWTLAMVIAVNAGAEGLRLYVENGGKFNPKAQTVYGSETEETIIEQNTGSEGRTIFQAATNPKVAEEPQEKPDDSVSASLPQPEAARV